MAPEAASTPSTPRLELRGITKRYPSVVANDGVSLAVAPGEIHAVLGENGAGKSTLMKIVYGAVQPDAGTILVDGKPLEVRNPHDARRHGIAMVFQHLSLFESLTVAQNVWLGLEPGGRALDRVSPPAPRAGASAASRRRGAAGGTLAQVTALVRDKARAYRLDLDPERPVHALSIGERQRVEIVRALLAEPRLLILDEPTAVLAPQAIEGLFATLRQLAAEGCSILYISHKLDEIRALCERCTVMRAGRVTGTVDPRRESNASLSRLMIGEEPKSLVHRDVVPGRVALAVRGLSLAPRELHGIALHDIAFELRVGEVLGVAGVSGSGQQALLAALAGEDRRARAGTIRLFGADVAREGPTQRRRRGLHVVPEERLGKGAVPSLSLAANTLLTRREPVRRFGWLDPRAARALAARVIDRFRVKAAGPHAPARSLSGGNLQKFIVGREIDAGPKVLVVAQPTWGVDVGAASQIRAQLLALREAGGAVLLISEDLDELFELCDRLVVMARGRTSPSLARAQASVESVGAWMAGVGPSDNRDIGASAATTQGARV
jgi:simple sugar transport system ATP-binding protein